jgi:hypothetical protein
VRASNDATIQHGGAAEVNPGEVLAALEGSGNVQAATRPNPCGRGNVPLTADSYTAGASTPWRTATLCAWR